MSNLRRSWAELSLEKKLSIVVVPLVVAAIGAGVPLLAADGGGETVSRSDDGGADSTRKAPVAASVIPDTEPPITMIVPSGRTEGSSPGPDCDSFRAWALKIGGVDAGRTRFRLLVQSNTHDPVFVAGLRARISSKQPPASGVVVTCPAQAGLSERRVRIDLDKSSEGQYVRSGREQPFNFVLSRGESEVFNVTAKTRQNAFRWVLQVDAVVAGTHKVITVTERGKPFATSAYDRNGGAYYWNYADAWDLRGGDPTYQDRSVPAGDRLVPIAGTQGGG